MGATDDENTGYKRGRHNKYLQLAVLHLIAEVLVRLGISVLKSQPSHGIRRRISNPLPHQQEFQHERTWWLRVAVGTLALALYKHGVDRVPNSLSSPAFEVVIDRRPPTETGRQLPPLASGFGHLEHPV